MKKRWGIIVLLLIFGSVTLSHATLMETTWTAVLANNFNTTIDGHLYEGVAGTVFTATSIYDDDVRAYNYWTDGDDGIAQSGAGDDSFDGSHAWGPGYSSVGADLVYASNASVGFSQSFLDLFGYFNDTADINYAIQFARIDGSSMTYMGDGVTIRFNDNYNSSGVKSTGLVIWDNPNNNTYNQVGYPGWVTSDLSLSTRVYTPPEETDPPDPGGAAVPEPATIILLGSGLIGLAGFRKKLKK